ncbi:MAG: ParB/RepB/Spo0J family partition protein [Nitrososphaeria archaeon]
MVFQKIRLSDVEPTLGIGRILGDSSAIELLDSMQSVGQLAPIKVRPHPTKVGKYQLVYGHRRYAAALRLGWETIMAEVEDLDDEAMLQQAIVENIQRKDLTDYEKALLFERLHVEFNRTYDEIARLVGKSKQYVANHIAMLRLFDRRRLATDKELESLLSSLTEHHCRILARLPTQEERVMMAKLIIREKLCVRETDKLVGRIRNKQNGVDKSKVLNGIIRKERVVRSRVRVGDNGWSMVYDNIRICFIREGTLNKLIANLAKSPYEVGKEAGADVAKQLQQDAFNPHDRKRWSRALREFTANARWGKVALMSNEIIEVQGSAIDNIEFFRGYLEGYLGVSLHLIECRGKDLYFRILSTRRKEVSPTLKQLYK